MHRFFCCDERRREAVAAGDSPVNGIDFVEVDTDPAAGRRRLTLRMLRPLGALAITAAQVRVTDVSETRPIVCQSVTAGTRPDTLVIQLAERGGCARYRLRLVRSATDSTQPDGVDPILCVVDFSFFPEEGEPDCQERACAVEPAEPAPVLDYLTKDYASFRRLMLDRISVLAPDYASEHPADPGVMLVEALSYVADKLSYAQDAIATEAYLHTARRRVSVRRHAKLVDYRLGEGANARSWVRLEVSSDVLGTAAVPALPAGTRFIPRVAGQSPAITASGAPLAKLLSSAEAVFESLFALRSLRLAQNSMSFYTWGALDCRLPRGATRATLRGHGLGLSPGDFVLLEDIEGAERRRHVVRISELRELDDPIGGRFATPPQAGAQAVTELTWSSEDALPFALCVSRVGDSLATTETALARGNLLLADHGYTEQVEVLGSVPEARLVYAQAANGPCSEQPASFVPPRFAPCLGRRSLTWAVPFDGASASAYALAHVDARGAEPSIELFSFSRQVDAPVGPRPWLRDALPSVPGESPERWQATPDLLGSAPDARDFSVEQESDGRVFVRFGDGRAGRRPAPDSQFFARYRIGSGRAGNLPSGALAHVLASLPQITKVDQPLPAAGGIEPESVAEARVAAPQAFRRNERAVTTADYASFAESHPEVQRARATFRWTGSFRTVFLSIDRRGGLPVDTAFRRTLRAYLERYRLAGHDLEVVAPRYVPLHVVLRACAARTHFRRDVERAISELFSARILPDGRLGLFHPDRLTFGEPVLLSPLYAAAVSVAGVHSVEVTTFERLGEHATSGIDSGRIEIGHLEVPVLDGDGALPVRGKVQIHVEGGK